MNKKISKKKLEIIQKKLFSAIVFISVFAGAVCFLSDIPLKKITNIIIEELKPEELDTGVQSIGSFMDVYVKGNKDFKQLLDEDAVKNFDDVSVQDVCTVVMVNDEVNYVVNINGRDTSVRLIGVDIRNDKSKGKNKKDDECQTAVKEKINEKINEKMVLFIEYDEQKTDSTGNTLAYLYFQNGQMLQEWLLENDIVKLKSESSNTKHYERLKEADDSKNK